MLWLAALLFAASSDTMPDVTTLRLDRNGWIVESVEQASAGETHWWWSAECAPQKSEEPGADCAPARVVRVHVVDAKRRPVPNVRIVWATEEMLQTIPDSRLPWAVVSEDGEGRVAAPEERDIWVRLDSRQITSAWTRVAANDSTASIVASASAPLRVEVRGTDGRPVRRARIALVPLSCDTICPQRLLAHHDGEHAPVLPAVEGVTYRVLMWSDSHAPVARTVTARRAADFVLEATPGSSISARIVDGEKNPIQGADLELRFAFPSLRQFGRRFATQTNGHLTMDGLPAGPVEWAATASGFARRIAEASLSERLVSLGDITLRPARTVHVVVVDGAGEGVPNARVVAQGGGFQQTNESGSALFDALPREEVELVVKAEGYLPATATIGPDQKETTVTMDRGASVTATLLRESDATAPAEVQVRITNRGTESFRTFSSDPVMEISALRSGPTRLRITTPETSPFDTGSFDLNEGESLDLGIITLKTGYSLHGVITDENGTAVSGARIRALRLDGDAPALANVLGNWVETLAKADGSFRLSGLSAGSQVVAVGSDGFAQVAIPNILIDEESRETDLGTVSLARGKEVQIICRPIKRCGTDVAVLLAGSDFPFLSIRAPLEEGRATVHAVGPGEKMLRLMRSQHAIYDRPMRIGSGTSPETIEVALPSVRVSGQVTLSGRAARGGSLFFERSLRSAGVPILLGRQTSSGSTLSREWSGSMGASTTASVDDRGRFATEEIEPGEYEVTYRVAGSLTTPTDVTVRDAAEQIVDLAFDAHEIGGIVVDRDDRPVAARIEVIDSTGRVHSAASGTDGRFRIMGIGAGEATVKATTSTARATLHADPSDRSALDLVLRLNEEKESFAVRVTDAAGQPAGGALVFGVYGAQMVVASTDGKGEAELRGLGDGAIHVAAHRVGGSWVFGMGQAKSPLRLQFADREGALTVTASKRSRILSISSPTGFPLDRVLPMTGVALQVGAGSLLQIRGLPPGQYTVGVDSTNRQAIVATDQTTALEFD